MLNLIFSLLFGTVLFVPFYLWLGAWLKALPPALIGFVAIYFYLSRRTWKATEMLFQEAMQILEPLQKRPELANHPERRNAVIDESIRRLESGFALAKWQFFLASQIHGQIGIILFSIKQDLKAAQPHLEKSFRRNWMAQAMLAISHLKRHKPEQMEETFEMAVRLNKKQDLLWNLYAYSLCKIKKTDRAIEVLGRAQKALPANNTIIENLVALQNNKKMKMSAYGDQWYQFHLEKPPVPKQRFARR
jgi:predicted Zn-dependent protease